MLDGDDGLGQVVSSLPGGGRLQRPFVLPQRRGRLAAAILPEAAGRRGAAYASAFRYFSPTPVIRDGVVPLGDVAVLSLTALVCWVVAVWAFSRRDLIA